MSDDGRARVSADEVFRSGQRVYRRRRKFQGATWTPASLSAEPEDGAWCKHCRKRHGYAEGLGISYVKHHSGRWMILWLCPKTGNVVEELMLGDTNTS